MTISNPVKPHCPPCCETPPVQARGTLSFILTVSPRSHSRLIQSTLPNNCDSVYTNPSLDDLQRHPSYSPSTSKMKAVVAGASGGKLN